MIKIRKLVSIFLFLSLSLFANETKEINIYTVKKYKLNYSSLKKEQQDKIVQEYKQLQVLSNKIYSSIKDDSLYAVNNKLNIIESWSVKFMNDYKPKENKLKDIYSKNSFNTNPEYKLKTITLKDEKRAQSIIRQLTNKKIRKDRINLFNIFVKKDSIDESTKDKQGNLGWINYSKLLPNIKKEIVKLNINDIMILRIKDNIQIVYLEDKKEPRKATYEEAKTTLIQLAKKQVLNKEIQNLIK